MPYFQIYSDYARTIIHDSRLNKIWIITADSIPHLDTEIDLNPIIDSLDIYLFNSLFQALTVFNDWLYLSCEIRNTNTSNYDDRVLTYNHPTSMRINLKTPLQPNQAYLIIPQLVCKGCVQTTLYDIVHQIPESLLSKVICIASDTSLFPPQFSNKVFQTMYDSTPYIDRLDISLNVNNVTLLYKRADSSKYVLTSNAKTHQSFVSQLQTFLSGQLDAR